MPRAITAYSTSTITKDGLQTIMDVLKAGPDKYGWMLERNGRRVFIEINTRDMGDMPDELIRPVAELLKDWPKSSVVFIYNDSAADDFEGRMARAIAVAMAERWPIVLDDHATQPEIIYGPGQRPPKKDLS